MRLGVYATSMNQIQLLLGMGCGNAEAAHNRERFGMDGGEMGNKIDLRRDGTPWMSFATSHVDWLHRYYTVMHKMTINNTYLMAYVTRSIFQQRSEKGLRKFQIVSIFSTRTGHLLLFA